MWHVVVFFEEDTVGVIPANWIIDENDNLCQWPACTKVNVSKLIINCSPLDEFIKITVRFIANNLSTYEQAIDVCNKAEYSSNVDSDNGEGSQKKRKRKPPARLISSDTEESETLDEAYPLPKQTNTTANLPPLPAVPLDSPKCRSKTSQAAVKEQSKKAAGPSTSSENVCVFTPLKFDVIPSPTRVVKEQPAKEVCKRQLQFRSNQKRHNEDTSEVILGKIDEMVSVFRVTNGALGNMTKEFQTLVAALSDVNERLINTVPGQTASTNVRFDFDVPEHEAIFPLKKSKKLKEVEQRLLTDLEFRDAAGGSLLHRKDKNVSLTMRAIYAFLLSDKLAEKFSLVGFKRKKIFKDRLLFKFIYSAAKKLYRSTSYNEITKPICSWLAGTKFRLFNELKKKRRQNNSKPKHPSMTIPLKNQKILTYKINMFG